MKRLHGAFSKTSLRTAALAALSSVFCVAGCAGGVGAKTADDPDVTQAVTSSLKAELAESGKPLPEGKVISWDIGNGQPQYGTAKVTGHDSSGCYQMDVRVIQAGSPYASASDYQTGSVTVCPNPN